EVASHTAYMDPILDELRAALAGITPQSPAIPFISTVFETTPVLDAQYWVANVRRPARVAQAVTAAANDYDTFIEISPHPLLTHVIDETLAAAQPAEPATVTSTLRRGDDETLDLHTRLAALGAAGTGAGQRTDLPATPWLHTLHWLAGPATTRAAADTHPLLGVHVELLTGGDHVWQTELDTAAAPWLAANPIQGQAVLPAAALIEMALAAGRHAHGAPVELTDLTIEQPLLLDRQVQVTTQFTGTPDTNRVEIHARTGNDAWARYAVGQVRATSAADTATAPAGGSDLTLPADAGDHPHYSLHPLLLDAALRQLAAGIDDDGDHVGYLPVSAATVRVFGPAGDRLRCHTELSGRGDDGAYTGRIVLTDLDGRLVAELTGIRLQPIDPSTLRLPLDQKVFATEWTPADSPAAAAESAPVGSWLVLTEPADTGSATLAGEFAARLGAAGRRVVPGPFADEPALRDAITAAGAEPAQPPAGIVVFLGSAFDGAGDAGLERARELIWTASTAARTAIETWPGATRPRLWLVTRNGLAFGDQPGDPAIGALKGLIRTWRFPGELARVLADEPDLGATLVDLDGTDDVDRLLAELVAPVRDDTVAWRAGQRYAERLTRAQLDASAQTRVRADGSYVITGGLGGLGIVVARWLAGRGAGRIVLNGRSEPSAEQRAVLAGLGAATEVVFVAGDISAPGVADRLVTAAEETGRGLRGVVHAAGVLGDGLVTAVTRDSLAGVWSAKATGALRLHNATLNSELDWWLGFSSMAALLGLPGQLGYATSNAWLDALVAFRHASGLPATAIDWGQWSDVGLGRSMTLSVLDPISPDEGVEALDTLLGTGAARVGVGRLRIDRAVATAPEFRDLGYFAELVGEADAAAATAGDGAGAADPAESPDAGIPDWSQIPAERRLGELTVRLQAILARELRTSAAAVDVDRPFPEMGLDSMVAMTVLKETQQLVGVDLSASMLWNHPSVGALAKHLVGLLAVQQPPQDEQGPDDGDLAFDSAGGVLDELFGSVESASAGSENGVF
ncbi:SDR family oxidoreductase, partial [Mycobacterium sp. M1]